MTLELINNPVDTSVDSVLSVHSLSVAYAQAPHAEARRVVHDVSFELARGTMLTIVGQSGSGKTTLAQAIGGLLPTQGRIQSGQIELLGEDVAALSTHKQWQSLRRGTIGYIPQDPLSSLDPLQRVGRQVEEAFDPAERLGHRESKRRTLSLLEDVDIADPESKFNAFPHELSGGQLQRILIAIAIASKPQLVIADEPTSALDVTVQRTILDLLRKLQDEMSLSILLITHDLALAADRSDTIVVLNEGRILDMGSPRHIITSPENAYTRTLFNDAPSLTPEKYLFGRVPLGDAVEDAVSINRVSKAYSSGRRSRTSKPGDKPALDSVSFRVKRGSIHALVGESGSGKTTAARIIAGLTGFQQGTVTVNGREVPSRAPRHNRHPERVQLLYQNALAAVDPRYTVEDIIGEPLRIRKVAIREIRARVRVLLDSVNLDASFAKRRPHEISGGQRQRVALARSLILSPQLLVLDEPTSALDVTVQAQIIDVLVRLHRAENLTYLFISHDLSLVRQIADDVTVLQRGHVVESGVVDDIFTRPKQAYTKALIDSIPGQSWANNQGSR